MIESGSFKVRIKTLKIKVSSNLNNKIIYKKCVINI